MKKIFYTSEKTAAVTGIILVFLTVFIFFHGLFKGEVIATNDVGTSDLLYATFPVQAIYGESLKHGEFLQWNPYIWGGFPVFAEGPYGFLYPVDLIAWYLFEPVTAMNIVILLNPIIMGFGMFLFARRLTNSAWTAILPAAAAAVCGPMLVHARHYSASAAMALIPYLFYAAESFVQGKRKFSAGLFYGAITGLMVLTGHPQYVFICVFITSVYFFSRLLLTKENDIFAPKTKSNAKEIILFFLSAGIIAAVIGFPQLKETFTLVQFSQRSTETLSDSFTGLGSLPWKGFLTFINPYFMGNAGDNTFKNPEVYLFWEYFHYAGVAVLILALIGIYWGWKKSYAVKALTLTAVLFYLFALGNNFPLYKIFSAFPFVKAFRFQVRWLLGTEMTVIALSGFGVYAIYFFLGSLKSSNKKQVSGKKKSEPKKRGIAAPSPVFVLAASIAVIFEIYLVSGRQVVTADSSIYLSTSPLIQKIQSKNDGRQYSIGSTEFFRSVYQHSHGWEGKQNLYALASKMLPPNFPSLFHVPVIYGYTALVPNYIYEVWGDANHSGIIHLTAGLSSENTLQTKETFVKLCKMWQVKYFTSIWKMQEPFVKTWDSLGIYNYELPEVFPRTYVISKILRTEKNVQKEAQKILDNNFNPLEEAVSSDNIPMPPDSKNGTAEILSLDNHSIKIKANEAGLVVLSDTWYPKWTAAIDGKETQIYRVNSSMRGVISPKPGSIIEMNYDRGGVIFFALISYIVLIVSLAFDLRPAAAGKQGVGPTIL